MFARYTNLGGDNFGEHLLGVLIRLMMDCLELAAKALNEGEVGTFIAVLWESWNARKRFLFQELDHNLIVLEKRAASHVQRYRSMKEKEPGSNDVVATYGS